jgi:hypothetical protein
MDDDAPPADRETILLGTLEELYRNTQNPLFIWYALHRIDFQSKPLPPWIDAYLKRAASYWHRYGRGDVEDGPAGLLDLAGTPIIPGEGVGPIYAGTPPALAGLPASAKKARLLVARALELVRPGSSAFDEWRKLNRDSVLARALAVSRMNHPQQMKKLVGDEADRSKRTSRTVQSRLASARRLSRAATPPKEGPIDET